MSLLILLSYVICVQHVSLLLEYCQQWKSEVVFKLTPEIRSEAFFNRDKDCVVI